MEEVVRTAAEATSGLGIPAFLGIIAALVAVITVLGQTITSLIQKKTNPLNGTLVKLESTLSQVNTSLGKMDVRTETSNRVLEKHTEKLMSLVLNETAQTKALLDLGPAIENSLTGCASRITEHCNDRSKAIIDHLTKDI